MDDRMISKSIPKLSERLNGKFTKDFASCIMKIDNEFGKGSIACYDLHPGLSAMIFNIYFEDEIEIGLNGPHMQPLYFVFTLKGTLRHRFLGDFENILLDNLQNCIITSEQGKSNIFTIPRQQKIEASIIFVHRDINPKNDYRYIRNGIADIFMNLEEFDSYRYLGRIRPKMGEIEKLLIHHGKKGVVGRLMTESFILRILASQLQGHNEETNSPQLDTNLRKKEIKKVLKLAQTLSRRLSESLNIDEMAQLTGLNPKKLQSGFRHLFGMSINEYHKNLRLDKALEMVVEGDQTISEIVYGVGLSSRSYFSKIFREKYGKSPSEYRELLSSKKTA